MGLYENYRFLCFTKGSLEARSEVGSLGFCMGGSELIVCLC
jgi:hypothetical protein